MYPPLPIELYHCILEYIAYIIKTLEEPDFGHRNFQLKCPSPELFALSAVNRQIRRVCLPFLFANIHIKHDEDAKNLEKHLALCAKFTKTLALGKASGDFTEVGQQIISRLLPQLERLLDVRLGDCLNRSDLLRTMLACPTITSVEVDGLPDVVMCKHDLSKVILHGLLATILISPTLEEYFERGMRVMCISLGPKSVNDQLCTQTFPGLQSIEIFMDNEPVSFSWLSRFSSTHPALNELLLLEIEQDLFTHDNAPPFLSSLVEEFQQQNLWDTYMFTTIGLRRAKPIGGSSEEWDVVQLWFTTVRPETLIERLSFLASAFPKLEILTITLEEDWLDEVEYNIVELSSVFACFSSLRVVRLDYFYSRLSVRPENEHLVPIQPLGDDAQLAFIERAKLRELLAFICCLAKRVKTLDLIHILDFIVMDDTGYWLEGWFHVVNSDRVIKGIFVQDVNTSY
ncbi:hypothetical protein F5880DRAFT_1549246 [Lentinula raphanica]|nr:hypothetical protein F5880DRAFT_1549246 [Lentinula raphanica]